MFCEWHYCNSQCCTYADQQVNLHLLCVVAFEAAGMPFEILSACGTI